MIRRIALLLGCVVVALPLLAAERTVDPTFLHRYLPDAREQHSDITTATCHYKPIFGAGDSQGKVPHGVARFGLRLHLG